MPEGKVEHLGVASDEATMWSLVEVGVGEAIGFVPSLRCFPRAWDGVPPVWTGGGGMRAVRVESEAFGSRFDARVAASQEDNWLLQLLSPDFVHWLSEAPQAQFGFEIHEGVVRCFTPGHVTDEAADRLLAESERVAERVRAEALESEGLGVRELGSGIPERIERAVGKVTFDSPPPDSLSASRPFRRFAARDPRVYIAALGGVLTGFAILLWILFEVGLDAIDLIVTIVGWVGPKGTGIALGTVAVLGWLAALPEAIAIASRSYGRIAFAREYARAHDYALESPQSFHRRVMRVDLPAPAQIVMRGAIGGRRQGRLVLCRSERRLFASHADAVIFDVGDHADGLGSGDGFEIAVDAGHLVVWRSSSGDRGATELDQLVEHALGLLERLENDALALADPRTASAAAVAGAPSS